MKSKIEIYDALKAKLPLTRMDDDFMNYVKEVLNEYLKLIRKVNLDSYKLKPVNDFITGISEVLEDGLSGDKENAYLKFKDLLNKLLIKGDSGFHEILPIMNADYTSLYELQPEELNYYFRVTEFEESIIHLPFQKLDFSRNDLRFSAKGIPCFYGGSSILTCFNETGGKMKPAGLVSCFEIEYSRSPLLDLTMPNFNINETPEAYLDRYILSWPLIALCMIRKMETKGDQDLIPEYLIPMFTITALSDPEILDINAVRYYSTKPEQISDNHINIAIPAQTKKDYGYCEKILDVFRDKDRDPLAPNYLRITKPKLLCEMLDPENPSFEGIEMTLKRKLEFSTDLIGADRY